MYLDTRDLQEQIDNLESEIESVEEYIEESESELEELVEELVEIEEETGAPQPEPPEIVEIQTKLQEYEEQLQDLRDELQPLLDLKAEDIPEWDDGATLISADKWEEYVEDLVKDCGYIPNDVPWWIIIDWAATADNVVADYSTVDYDGDTYYYRNC